MLFSGVATAKLETATPWYEALPGRPADIVANEDEVMWQICDGGWLYLMSPQGNMRAGTGDPTWVDHTILPRPVAFKAYTLSVSVATITSLPSTRGSPKICPWRARDVQAFVAPWNVDDPAAAPDPRGLP